MEQSRGARKAAEQAKPNKRNLEEVFYACNCTQSQPKRYP